MMAGDKAIILFVSIICISFVNSAVVKGTGHNSTYDKTKGVCHLEVRTIDLIHKDDRFSGYIPESNGSRSGYSSIQVCCSGYKLMDHSAFHCVPACKNDCEHGNCTSPNVCVCQKGYIKDPTGACVPTCPIGCLNGVCSVAKTCSCNSGYFLDPKGEMCLPTCRGGCGIGGDCIAPDICECRPGFEKSSRGFCEHHCDGGCDGGDCVGPNQCQCRPGYINRQGACEAACVGGCKNGDCLGPNKCVCKNGWTLDKAGTGCEAHCAEPCLNGECSGPDQCTCKNGYVKDTFKANRCIAHCPGGCDNGVCSAPNFCICNHGYLKQSKGSNKCIKRERRYALHYELLEADDEV